MELFEQSAKERMEFLGASGTVEHRVDDIAGEKAMLEGIESRRSHALIRARASAFLGVGAARRELAR